MKEIKEYVLNLQEVSPSMVDMDLPMPESGGPSDPNSTISIAGCGPVSAVSWAFCRR